MDDNAHSITIMVDETRDQSPMNAGQRMARISLGAAVENMVRTAELNFGTDSVLLIDADNAVTIKILRCASDDLRDDPVIRERTTNRRLYDPRPVPVDIRRRLITHSAICNGIGLRWAFDRTDIGQLAELIGAADAMMFTNADNLRAFLANIRFDLSNVKSVDEGLSVASLELTQFQARSLNFMRKIPAALLWIFATTFKKNACTLVDRSSGLCVGVCAGNDPQTDIYVGREMQRAWLQMTALGLAVQPMMSLPVLDGIAHYGREKFANPREANRLADLLQRVKTCINADPSHRICFLLRFGFAPSPSGHSDRRSISRYVA